MTRPAPLLSPQNAQPGATRRRWNAWLAAAGFWALCVPSSLPGFEARAANVPTEFQVKAAFLFNFLKFTEWPASAFPDAAAPLIIGVVGNDPFGRTLDDLVKGERIKQHPLVVRRFRSGEDCTPCHVLFISRSEQASLPDLLGSLKQKPVLTISDLDQFCQQNGMVNLVLSAEGKVKPEINPGVVHDAGLEISSKLLNLPMVRIVKTGG